MKCPYCKAEMEYGYIHNSKQPVQWFPNYKKPSYIVFKGSKDGINLFNTFALIKSNGYKAEAYYCPHCKIVIAPTE